MDEPHLKRSLSLPLVVLYGLGVTIGAGIYVLLGAAAGQAGIHAPFSFVIAVTVVAFSAASFAELSGRLPFSAGEAAYVRAGFRSDRLSLFVGLLVITMGTVSCAAIAVGSIGYVQVFVALPDAVLIALIVLSLGGIAAWGITESVALASLFTVVEVAALLFVAGSGIVLRPEILLELPRVVPGLEAAAWVAAASGGLLAFFAFIGFEDIVNLAEEVKQPERNLPWAILLTLLATALVYFLVASVAVLSMPIDELADAPAPLSLLFVRLTGASPVLITAIAIVATLNGVIIQIIMASRVLYGLARQHNLPEALARVDPRTRTPLVATATIVAIVLVLALAAPLAALAEWTSRIALVIFAFVNLALWRLKRRGEPAPAGVFTVPQWVPVAGFASCVGLLAVGLLL